MLTVIPASLYIHFTFVFFNLSITYTYITVLFIDNHAAIEYHLHDYISTYLCMYSVYLFHICIYIEIVC